MKKKVEKQQNDKKSQYKTSKTKPKNKYMCFVCNKSFTYKNNLTMHRKFHMIDHRCPICDKVFTTKRSLRKHATVHSDRRPYECKMCDKTFKLPFTLKAHEMAKHERDEEGDAKCGQCNKSFINKFSLKRHIYAAHKHAENTKCDICQKTLKNVARHKKIQHPIKINEDLQCKLCSVLVASKNMMKKHMITHTGLRIYKCDLCPKSYKHLSTLGTHKKTHLAVKNDAAVKEREWSCSLCLKVLSCKYSFKKHKLLHGDLKRYECIVCKKTFKWYSSLWRHRIDEHDVTVLNENGEPFQVPQPERERDFKCAICDKAYMTKGNLRTHLLGHTDVKKYKCSVCLKSYKLKRGLIAHKEREKHGHIKARKRLECDQCDSTFTAAWTLEKHLKSHNKECNKSYKCEVCEETFVFAKQLREHVKTEHKDYRYKCYVCSSSYSQIYTLHNHMRTAH